MIRPYSFLLMLSLFTIALPPSAIAHGGGLEEEPPAAPGSSHAAQGHRPGPPQEALASTPASRPNEKEILEALNISGSPMEAPLWAPALGLDPNWTRQNLLGLLEKMAGEEREAFFRQAVDLCRIDAGQQTPLSLFHYRSVAVFTLAQMPPKDREQFIKQAKHLVLTRQNRYFPAPSLAEATFFVTALSKLPPQEWDRFVCCVGFLDCVRLFGGQKTQIVDRLGKLDHAHRGDFVNYLDAVMPFGPFNKGRPQRISDDDKLKIADIYMDLAPESQMGFTQDVNGLFITGMDGQKVKQFLQRLGNMQDSGARTEAANALRKSFQTICPWGAGVAFREKEMAKFLGDERSPASKAGHANR